jgi:hypothetical protein
MSDFPSRPPEHLDAQDALYLVKALHNLVSATMALATDLDKSALVAANLKGASEAVGDLLKRLEGRING